MEKLVLVDAYALIYRGYYAFINNPRINSKGLNTSAIMGFLNTLSEILNREHPAYLGVAFDHGKTFRHELFPAYKAQRATQPEDITRSVPIIRDLLAALRIPCLQADGFEADDVIGTIATLAHGAGVETYMFTPDKDFAQLVTQDILLCRLRHGGGYEVMDERAVCEKYDVGNARQIIDLLALMGDASDNFPGCPGVGQKTAVQLIKQFGGVDELLCRTAELTGKLRERVEDNVDNIRLAQVLATIRTDVPIALDLAALRVKEADEKKLRALFGELEFKTLLIRFIKSPQAPVKNVESDLPKSPMKPLKTGEELDLFGFAPPVAAPLPPESSLSSGEGDLFAPLQRPSAELSAAPSPCQMVEDLDALRRVCALLARETVVALALSTDTNRALDAHIASVSLSTSPETTYQIPLPADAVQAKETLQMLRPLFESTTIMKVGHNLKYIIEVLRNYRLSLCGPLFDTMVAHYLLHPELRHTFDYLCDTLLGVALPPSAADSTRAALCLPLYTLLKEQLTAVAMDELFYHIEMPLVSVLADMEYTGVVLDTRALRETSAVFTQRMAAIEEEIYHLAGHAFNISSPRQVGDVLFSELKVVEKPKKTKTGQYVTNEEELQKIASKHAIVQKILDYRGLKKLVSTYIDALPLLIHPRTGRIHTSFNQTVTATGRLSSSDPNLQNIPIRGEDGKEIRRCFVPEHGCLFFSADYSQIELRVMAHLSNDENMLSAFRQGQDIHASTAAKVYKKPIDAVTRDERAKAKRANFGIIYGITPWGLAERLLIDKQEAKALIDGYFDTFPQVREYMESAKASARDSGYAETLYHRRRYLPDILSANVTVRAFSERNAVNAPIQGTAADIIKIAMVRIYNRFHAEGLRSKMILQVHDELNFSVYPDEKARVEQIVISEMENACALRVPLVAAAGWGENWLEAH